MLRLNLLTRSMLILSSGCAIGLGSGQTTGHAATLAQSTPFTGIYQFEGDSPNATVTGNEINFTPWQAGSGIKTGYAAGKPGRAFTGNGNWTATSTPDANDYFQFSLVPTAGDFFDITEIKFDSDRSATGPQSWQLNAKIGNQAPIVLSESTNPNSIWNTFTIGPNATLSNLTQPITFTLYGFAATGNAGTWRVDNITVSGAVNLITTPKNPGSATPVPEPDAVPTPMLLPALLGLGLKLRQRLAQ
jgi:hypothetical protein